MTGAYLRIKRDGKWQNIEVEHLTNEEREELFVQRSPEEIVRWLNTVCYHLCHMDNQLNELAEEHMNNMQEES